MNNIEAAIKRHEGSIAFCKGEPPYRFWGKFWHEGYEREFRHCYLLGIVEMPLALPRPRRSHKKSRHTSAMSEKI